MKKAMNNFINKAIICFLALCVFALTAAVFTGCSDSQAEQGEKIDIVCSIFPQYDWVRQIIGEDNTDRYNLTLLINNGIDLHSYEPSPQDIVTVKTCDVFIYVGGHSDTWVDDIVKDNDTNPNMIKMNLMEVLDGHILIDEHHECDDPDHDHEEGEAVPDEHVWTSLKNAKIVCSAITDVLVGIDAEKSQSYKDNLESYTAELAALDSEFQSAVDAGSVKTLVFADRFPFRYLTTDYGLTYHAAFSGCSAEVEASFVTVTALATRVDQLGLNKIMVTESSDKGIANTVKSSTKSKNQEIVVLNSLQTVSNGDTGGGDTYLDVMKNNLESLKIAVNN